MIVTFDFDLNLKFPISNKDMNYPDVNKPVLNSFYKHMEKGHTIYIVTSRLYSRFSLDEIRNFLKKYDLEVKDIIHTNGDLKANTLKKLGSQLHYDDDPEELKAAEAVGIKTIYTYNQQAEEAFDRWMNSL